ncbi:hypothetical protein [Streptomyces californicus]|uniref:hypothetical protein n=1 Tax=Streptomyces californicus TaxID=67351 RepID=UPI00296E654F|nr:hypothetical protein [Streptomyces californicus]MDW4916283.1 hypothetical protein [Streptomyces californicus]
MADHLVAGTMPDRIPRAQGTTAVVDQAISQMQAGLGVITLRALCFRLLALGLVSAPRPEGPLDLDTVTRTVWESLRWDILDVDLVPTVAAGLSPSDKVRLPAEPVNGALDRLTERFATSRHGLIRAAFAHGLLSGGQNVTPPAHPFPAPTPPGVGAWDPSPAIRRVLALRASGRTAAACAVADATTLHAVTGRLSAAKRLAGDVRTHRALIHRALCDGVLQQPALLPNGDLSAQERDVWRHFALDVPDAGLASRIGTHTGLGMSVVDRCMSALRRRFPDDCAVVYQGWRYGVLDADTPTDQTCCTVTGLKTAHTGGAR